MTSDMNAVSAAYRSALDVIAAVEPRIADATRAELADQRAITETDRERRITPHPAVLLTMGTWLSDKYAEGTIGHRFYAGCQNIDTVEAIAADHARELFGAPSTPTSQPHSGIDANLVAFWSILAHRHGGSPNWRQSGFEEVSTTMDRRRSGRPCAHKFGNQRACSGMSLDAGGHLTHGFRPNISGKMFHQRSYGTDPIGPERIDYDRLCGRRRT